MKSTKKQSSVMVSKLNLQTCKSEFVSHWVPHSFDIVPHLSKTLCKFYNKETGKTHNCQSFVF